jgi:hypothetical protein
MTNPTPPPCSPDLVPHAIAQDSPLDRDNARLLSFIPEASVADCTAMAGTGATVATSQCDDDCLKACIFAASASVWGVQDIFPAQLNAVYRLLHPTHPNHLAVIQRTGAVKTHILRTLGVIEWGIVLIFIPLLTLSANIMSKLTCADLCFGTVIIQHLNKL